jgi:signal transduction histidine kinase
MATSVAASEEIVTTERPLSATESTQRRSAWFRLGLRSRQIAVITLFVATVVAIITAVNVAHLTGVIVIRTEQEVQQLSDQIGYAVQQELGGWSLSSDAPVSYARLATSNSGVRSLMDSTIVTSRTISYLYLTNPSGQIITDNEGRNELAANRYLIGDVSTERPDFATFADQNGYFKFVRILFGAPIYEYRKRISSEGTFSGELRVGVSMAGIRRELVAPIATNLAIGMVAIVFAAIVAIGSANTLLRPLQAISTSIEDLSSGTAPGAIGRIRLPQDDMVTGVTARLRQLGERLAGERSELEIMRGRLRQVISHLEERLLMVNREGRVMLASPDAEQVLGMDSLDWTGISLGESLGRQHPLVLTVDRAFNERRSIARSALQVPTTDGTRQLLVSVQYIEDAGEPVGALVSLRDYESFQRFESQWDLSKKLADLGRITSGIAHEVKNPLNAMVIHLEILRSKVESGVDASAHLEILDSEIKRLDRVVQTFLNFTRPVDVHLAPVDLNAIVSQVVALASTEASGRGVSINQHLAHGRLLVKADSDLLKQALLNVIINGCQAMPEGGPLKVTTSNGGDGVARVAISDRGIGISDDARERIFNLYYTTKKGGTGIGLAQAFRAVQLHGGGITFDSEVGVGTTFEISLPSVG